MTTSEQIKHLNETVLCKLAPSKIHGVGVFALKSVKRGERLFCKPNEHLPFKYTIPYESFKDLREEVRELVMQRYPLVVKGSAFLSPNDDARLISFMNHSESPNYNPKSDKALRDIAKGEEILENYNLL